MKPEIWILIVVLIVLTGGSLAYWYFRRSRRRRRPRSRRLHRRPSAVPHWPEEDEEPLHTDGSRTVGPDAAGWYANHMNGAPGYTAAPPNPHGSRYTPEEIRERRRQRRFRPVCPLSSENWMNIPSSRPIDALRNRAQARESQVIREHAPLLRAWCRHHDLSEARKSVDEIIGEVYFRTTGLAIVSDAVCEVIENELAYGIVPQRLRVRLYNTYLAAARRALDEATWRVMYMNVVRKHPAYDELAQTVRSTETPDDFGTFGAFRPSSFAPYQRAGSMQAPFAPMGDAPEKDYGETQADGGEALLRAPLGLEDIRFWETDEDTILCIHEDNMEKLRAAVERMEQDDTPVPYEMQHLQLLIDLRKAYCSDFVLDFDKTIDTMPEDVCRQQLKLLSDMLQMIRRTYVQYPAI